MNTAPPGGWSLNQPVIDRYSLLKQQMQNEVA